MIKIYKQRFEELNQQMEMLLDSKRNINHHVTNLPTATISRDSLLEWVVKTKNLLSKACGQESEHFKAFQDVYNDRHGDPLTKLNSLKAVFSAAREDYEGGYLITTRSLIQAEVFDSELEQAQILLDAGYKSPAAVVAGVVLETSLRELCDRHSIEHGKLDKMNADIAKNGVYNKLQQKRITTIADIRNSAAHGKPDDFNETDAPSVKIVVASSNWSSNQLWGDGIDDDEIHKREERIRVEPNGCTA